MLHLRLACIKRYIFSFYLGIIQIRVNYEENSVRVKLYRLLFFSFGQAVGCQISRAIGMSYKFYVRVKSVDCNSFCQLGKLPRWSQGRKNLTPRAQPTQCHKQSRAVIYSLFYCHLPVFIYVTIKCGLALQGTSCLVQQFCKAQESSLYGKRHLCGGN